MLRVLATSADNTHNPTSAPPQYDDDFEDDEEQNETQNEEEEYYDDDFEEDEATPVAGRAVEGETEIMRAIREENERALQASNDRYRYGDENDRPIGGFDDRAFDFNSHARDAVPERKVKSFPGKGARHATTLTDQQIRAAHELQEKTAVAVFGQVEGHAAFARVQIAEEAARLGIVFATGREGTPGSQGIAITRSLHLDNLRAEVCQQAGGVGVRDVLAKFEDTEFREC